MCKYYNKTVLEKINIWKYFRQDLTDLKFAIVIFYMCNLM